jgi:hypothetical protein
MKQTAAAIVLFLIFNGCAGAGRFLCMRYTYTTTVTQIQSFTVNQHGAMIDKKTRVDTDSNSGTKLQIICNAYDSQGPQEPEEIKGTMTNAR